MELVPFSILRELILRIAVDALKLLNCRMGDFATRTPPPPTRSKMATKILLQRYPIVVG